MTSAPVMLGVDATAGSLEALAWALAECRNRDADLVLVHALDSADASLAARTESGQRTAAEIGRAVVEVHGSAAGQAAPDVSVTSFVSENSTAETLIEVSRRASLLVLGSRGRSGFTESVLGSVAHRVAVHSHSPVVVVPHNATAPRWLQLERIVVGVSDTHAGNAATDFAAEQAQRAGAIVILVHSSDPAAQSFADRSHPPESDTLTRIRLQLAARCPDLSVEVVATEQDPVSALIELSQTADLVVLGCHHSEEPWNTRLGAVPSGVLPSAGCPVVLVGQRP